MMTGFYARIPVRLVSPVFTSAKIYWLGLTLTLLGYNAIAQKRWTLQECLNYAHQNNLQVQQAGLAQEKSGLQVRATRNLFLPVVDARVRTAGNWGFLIDPSTNVLSNRFNFGNQASLNMSLDLFNGFANAHQVKLRNQELNSANYDSQITKNTVSLEIIFSYLQVLLAQEQLKNAQERLKILGNQQRKIKAQVDKGVISKRDLLSLQSLIASEDLLATYAQNSIEKEIFNLTQIIGLSPGTTIEVDAVPIPTDWHILEIKLEDVLAEAVSHLPDLKAAQSQVEVSYHLWQLERANYLPTLALTAQMGTRTSNYRTETFARQLGVNLNRQLGLSLYIPIFNRFTVRNNEQLAKINLQSSRLAYQQTDRQLRETIVNAFLDYRAALRKYKSLQVQYLAIGEENRYAERTFELGGIDAIEYSVIRGRWVTAQSEILQAKYACFFKQKVLDFYQGKPLVF